jgi:hypothetical protein
MTPSYVICSWDGKMGLCDGGKFASHGYRGKGSHVTHDRFVMCICDH